MREVASVEEPLAATRTLEFYELTTVHPPDWPRSTRDDGNRELYKNGGDVVELGWSASKVSSGVRWYGGWAMRRVRGMGRGVGRGVG